MKLAYLAPAPIPSRSANSVHVMKMCEALADNDCEVTLLVLKTERPEIELSESIFDFYAVKNNFRIKWIKSNKHKGQKIRYALKLLRYISKHQPDFVYSRDFYASAILCNLGIRTIFEFHHFKVPTSFPLTWLLPRLRRSRHLIGLVSITEALASQLVAYGFPREKMLIAPDAAAPPTTTDRKSLPNDAFKVGYLGHLYPGKGIEIIASLVPEMPEITFHIVGGQPADVASWRKSLAEYSNISFHGHVPQSEISAYLNSFDCCLLPNQRRVFTSGGNEMDIGAVTSPLKMFDYLAHGKAIVSSDLPVLREVLDESVALFADPDDPVQWKKAILSLQNDSNQRQRLATKSKELFEKKYSWNKRAKHVLAFIKSSS